MKTKKYIFDIIIITLSSIITLPLMLIISILIFIFMGKPVFYTQKRIGYKNSEFEIIKFRTMINNIELSDDDRVTYLGYLLRKTSLDELPEIFNILKGDMSLVGPRPLLPEYLQYYSKRELLRHDVMPGITGWAQIHGRNTLDWEEKFNLDIYYINNQTIILDIKIVFFTIIKVLLMTGINDEKGKIKKKFKR